MKVLYTIGAFKFLEKLAFSGCMTGEEFHGFKNWDRGKVSEVMVEYPPLLPTPPQTMPSSYQFDEILEEEKTLPIWKSLLI